MSTGIGRSTATTPAQARRSRPRWAALGVLLFAVAAVALARHDVGARLLLGAAGVAGILRGLLILRASALGTISPPARPLGAGTTALGAAALVVAAVPGVAPGRVLAVALPVLLLMVSAALLAREGVARRGGLVLLVWSLLVTGLLVAAGARAGWGAAAGIATVAGALCVAVLGVPLLVRAAGLRAPAGLPEPPPAAPAGCGGCACGAGGCGAALSR